MRFPPEIGAKSTYIGFHQYETCQPILNFLPRPSNKDSLSTAIEKEWRALGDPTARTDGRTRGGWRMVCKGLLTHLIEYEQMCLGWVTAGQYSEVTPLLALVHFGISKAKV